LALALIHLVSWKIRVHGRVLRLGRVWRKLGRGISGGLEEHVEAMGCGVYAFDGGGIIIKSGIKVVIHEGPNFSYLQSLLISGWAIAD
jgi:hypothetical protein